MAGLFGVDCFEDMLTDVERIEELMRIEIQPLFSVLRALQFMYNICICTYMYTILKKKNIRGINTNMISPSQIEWDP